MREDVTGMAMSLAEGSTRVVFRLMLLTSFHKQEFVVRHVGLC